jgi:tyrosyl-tRNA synthetase
MFASVVQPTGTQDFKLIGDLPTRSVSRSELANRLPIVDLLVASGLASSKADARRGIHAGGFYLNGRQILDVNLQVPEGELQGSEEERFVVLRKGKKNYAKLVLLP